MRSSANINAGSKTKVSAIIHGVLLAVTVIFIPTVLNLIPLASLAAILIMIGYKLAKLKLFKQLYQQGWGQFLPFCATIVGVLLTDLLMGIGIGVAVAIFFILKKNYHNNFYEVDRTIGDSSLKIITLSEEVSFLNKAGIVQSLISIEPNSRLIIDGTKSKTIDFDVLELIHEFFHFGAKEKNIDCRLINIPGFENNLFSLDDEEEVEVDLFAKTWGELKTETSWGAEIELPSTIEQEIIVFSLCKAIGYDSRLFVKIIESQPNIKVAILDMEKVSSLSDKEVLDLKKSIQLFQQRSIKVNIVGINSSVEQLLSAKSIIPKIIKEEAIFIQLSNCILNISFTENK